MKKAAVVLIVEDGKILTVSRKYDLTKFSLPGGKVDLEESPAEAAIREAFEETGIIVRDVIYIFNSPDVSDDLDNPSFDTFCYFANKWTGIPSCKEGAVVKWMSVNDLLNNGIFVAFNTRAISELNNKLPEVRLD